MNSPSQFPSLGSSAGSSADSSKPSSAWNTKSTSLFTPPTEEQLEHNRKMAKARKNHTKYYNSLINMEVYDESHKSVIFEKNHLSTMGPSFRVKFKNTLLRAIRDLEKEIIEATERGKQPQVKKLRARIEDLKNTTDKLESWTPELEDVANEEEVEETNTKTTE